MMKAAVILCMIPLALAATFLPEPPSPYTGPQIPPAAQADTFRQRFEPAYPSHTFVERWWPGDASFAPEPLSFEQRWAPVEQTWGRRVRTIPITKSPPEPSQGAVEAINTAVPLPQPRSKGGEYPPVVSGVSAHKPRPIRVADICTRHGMVKQVTNNGRSWKCRK